MLVLKDSVNIRMYPPYLNAFSSTRKMRKRHIAVTGNHLSPSYQNIFRMIFLRSLYWRHRALHHSKRVMNEKRSGKSKTSYLINFFRNLHKKLNGFPFSYSKGIFNTREIQQHSYIYCIMNFPLWSCIYKLKCLLIFPENIGKILGLVVT